jgi:hypothetical protein
MVASKRNLIVIAAIAGGMLWIERGHRITIEIPPAEVAGSAAAACPENEDLPHSADCFKFLQGNVVSEVGERGDAVQSTLASPELGPACSSNNENLPYSAPCLRFMLGWFRQANPESTP